MPKLKDFSDRLKEYASMTERELFRFLPPAELRQGRAVRAAAHSLGAGGKRIRPALVLNFCEMCGGSAEKALPVACALEYMHTFSLIHDDLPCMDNDDFRRGKPSCHKAFDEATALLAGDALAVLPFEIAAKAARDGQISDSAAIKVVSALAEAAGLLGMIGGQQIDTENAGFSGDPEEILQMYSLKTSALLKAACRCGVFCAECGKEEQYLAAASDYAENLGLAFQLIDDILDITGNAETLGKPVGSDEKSDKYTYAAVCGVERARQKAEEYTRLALSALSVFPDNGFAIFLTRALLERNA